MRKLVMTKKKTLKLILFLILIGFLLFAGFKVVPVLFELLKDTDTIRLKLESYGALAPIIYVLIQMLQVILVVIPADILTVTAGYVFGAPLAVILSLSGLLLGSMSAFYMARFFGRNFVKSVVKKEKLDKINSILNSSKGTVALFIICMIPLVPKDLLMYVAGITPIKERRLFPVYLMSRIPGVIIGASIGANTHDRDWKGIMMSVIGLVLLVIGTYLLNKHYKTKRKNKL